MLETPTVIQSIINGFDRSPSRLASDLVLAFSCLSLTLLQRWALTPWARLLSWLYRRCLSGVRVAKSNLFYCRLLGPLVVWSISFTTSFCVAWVARRWAHQTRVHFGTIPGCASSPEGSSLLVLGRFVGRWSSPTCRSARLGYRGFSTRYLSIVTYLCRSCAAFRARLMDHVRFCRIVIIFGGS